MLKKITLIHTLILLSTCFSTSVFSQNNVVAKNYSYITDRKFKDVNELLGWLFVPSMEELKDVSKTPLRPGDVSFGITRSNLYVQGKGIKGVYSVNNITPTQFGYQLQLMHANDPTLQGHLKIVMCGNYTCNLIFKRSPKDKEVIYHLAEIPQNLKEKETEFFTDKNELTIKAIDSLFNFVTYKPFLAFIPSQQKQIRLQISDNIIFKFSTRTRTVEKGKRKEGEAVDSSKIKIVKEFFISAKTYEMAQDGSILDETTEYKIEKMDWKEDTRVGANADDRFKITLKTKAEEEFTIYLNAKKTITFIDFEGIKYGVRGF